MDLVVPEGAYRVGDDPLTLKPRAKRRADRRQRDAEVCHYGSYDEVSAISPGDGAKGWRSTFPMPRLHHWAGHEDADSSYQSSRGASTYSSSSRHSAKVGCGDYRGWFCDEQVLRQNPHAREPRRRDEPQTAVSSTLAPTAAVNFSGGWICSGTDGDMEELMTALEMNWAMRQAAYYINYGVDYASRKVSQSGDEMEIVIDASPKFFTQYFRIGGGSQETDGPDGPCWVNPMWEEGGRALRIYQTNLDGSIPTVVRQYFVGSREMRLDMTTPSGVTASWFFKRQ